VPALAAVLVRVTERRRARSVWKFRPWLREVKMDRNAVETIGRECCVKPPDVVNWPPRGLCSKYRRVQLCQSLALTQPDPRYGTAGRQSSRSMKHVQSYKVFG
jgi:hypothetical protein